MQPEGVVFDAVAKPRAEGEMDELARLADALVEQLADTRQHYEQLRTDLDGRTSRGRAPAPSVEERKETPEKSVERMRLFALNLALSGSSREDVVAELHDTFGIDDAGEILDAVFPQTTRDRERRPRFGRRKGR